MKNREELQNSIFDKSEAVFKHRSKVRKNIMRAGVLCSLCLILGVVALKMTEPELRFDRYIDDTSETDEEINDMDSITDDEDSFKEGVAQEEILLKDNFAGNEDEKCMDRADEGVGIDVVYMAVSTANKICKTGLQCIADMVEDSTENMELTGEFKSSISAFALEILKKCSNDENVVISPISMVLALSMTANGADGDTLRQMEEVLCGGISISELNKYLKKYAEQLYNGEKAKLQMGNSIWIKDDSKNFVVKPEFLKTNAKYYNTDVFTVPFDNSTLNNINNWVYENTDGLIDSIIDEIKDDMIIYLINTVLFDAEWQDIYMDIDISEGEFNAADGSIQNVEMMSSKEYRYIEDENARGFIKSYDNGYDFVAILPNEGISVEEYLNNMTGEKLVSLLENREEITVYAKLPKFTTEYSAEMKEILEHMGMTDAFLPKKADFSGMVEFPPGSKYINVYISNVIHKAYVKVDERGTKAGAASAVIMYGETAMAVEETETVTLDRPFIYAIVDKDTNLPIFMGTVLSVE